MAINIIADGKWKQKQLEEEDEEEALSLCDLPDSLIDQQEEDQPRKPDSDITAETQEEFDFHSSWGGPVSKEPEMCTADEVFFQGQILPLFLSSKTPVSQHHSDQFKQCEWRSESLDHSSSSEFQSSNSSRSSSIRSQNSSSSTSSTTTTTTRISKPRVQNQFHTHPIRRSSSWEFFRLGVVRAPEIGLQDIKVRSTNNANKISVINGTNLNANSTNTSVKKSNKISNMGKSKNILKQLVGKSGGLFSGCKCSIETVQSGFVMNKSSSKSSNNKTESSMHAMKEKVLELKRQKNNKHSHRTKQENKAVSRLRTFEWINVHLHANYPDEEALLAYS